MFLAWFGQVGDAGVGAHEDIAGVQRALQEELLGLGQVDPPQRGLGQGVGRHQRQAVNPHLVNAIYSLGSQEERHSPISQLLFQVYKSIKLELFIS